MCPEMLLRWLPPSSVSHRPQSLAVMEQKVWFLNLGLQWGFAATACGSQGSVWTFGKTSLPRELVQHGNRLPVGSCCLHPCLDRALVDQVWSWGEPCFTRAEESIGPVPPVFLGFGGVSANVWHNHGVRGGTKTLCMVTDPESVTKSHGLLGRLEQLNRHSLQDYPGLWPPPILSPSCLDTSFLCIQKPWESALYHAACLMLCCSHTHPPLQKFALQRADQFSKVTQVVDKNPLKLLTKFQILSISKASPQVLQGTFYYRPWETKRGKKGTGVKQQNSSCLIWNIFLLDDLQYSIT